MNIEYILNYEINYELASNYKHPNLQNRNAQICFG